MAINNLMQTKKAFIYPVQISFEVNNVSPYQGIITAIAIVSIWSTSLMSFMIIDTQRINIIFLVGAIAWQTFFYTGLFITAHDAMHGAVSPAYLKFNHFIGSTCLFLFGCLSYQKLLKKHWQHHQNPATQNDPDFHNGKNKNIIAWYLHFMRGYWSWKQIIAILIIHNFGKFILHIPEGNLICFWVVPSLLSSLQLFYFGTFEPHREPRSGYTEPHHTQTIPRPVWLSFITCYHFGYHEEHHEYPSVPWWQLATVHRMRIQQAVDVNIK
ncbi:MAG: fatty acid desaturase [Calothrix sp. C42_A2020_038]|nr:fatty acid desaturase [Calothrix sp. C42_A2020_038]